MRKVSQLIAGPKGIIDNAAKTATFSAGSSLTRKTPVDTGQAASNYIATLGSPSPAFFAVPEDQPIGRAAAVQITTDNMIPVVRGWIPIIGAPFFFTNNTPYIEELAMGHSAQAAAGAMDAAARRSFDRAFDLAMVQGLKNLDTNRPPPPPLFGAP